MSATFKTYYALTKPGIIYGNAINTVGGFLLASRGHFNAPLFLATLLGSSLVIASGCVFNNYLDRDIDQHMERTKKRALVKGDIATTSALVFGTVLGVLGIGFLAWFTNWLTVFIGITGFIFYVGIYTYSKRHTVHNTLIGSISGAVPPLAGYCAVTGRLDMGAVLLFLIIAIWQMPHFYAIAMYRLQEYGAAKVPVLPAVKGMQTTKIYILAYIAAFTVAAVLLTVFGYTGYVYLAVMLIAGLAWFWKGFSGFKTVSDEVWGKGMFRFSLIVTLVFSIMISVSAFLR